jgi:D-alanyl-lipoteichoic acid acyltransferase DltB (MBOAT superfamily)
MNAMSAAWIAVLAATVALYWLVPARFRQAAVIAITASILVAVAPASALILSVFACGTFAMTRGDSITVRQLWLSLALVVVTLAYYKFRFFSAGGRAGDVIDSVVIPLGLSYYSFRCVHFILERYRGTIAQPSFGGYLGYLFFLPTLMVGPINRYQEYAAQATSVTWQWDDISKGMERLLFGYFKIAVLGNMILTGWFTQYISGIPPEMPLWTEYLDIVRDGLLLYILFSGYSDIAIGFALLLGIRIAENFNWPYFRRNIVDFWRSWHISLSSWSRDYIYFPVMGMTRNPYLAILASFLVIGIWHEISPRYIVWGLYHGVGILIWRQFQEFKRTRAMRVLGGSIPALVSDNLSRLLTLHFVFFGLVIVNRPNFHEVSATYQRFLFGWM